MLQLSSPTRLFPLEMKALSFNICATWVRGRKAGFTYCTFLQVDFNYPVTLRHTINMNLKGYYASLTLDI